MRYKIIGARMDSGTPVSLVIEAASRDLAERQANGMGYAVSRVTELGWGNPLRKYMDWCGGRSFVFQVALVAWTIFCALVGLMMLMSSLPNRRDPLVQMIPGEMDRQIAAWGAVGLCCPTATWALVAVPLGFAIVATWKSRS